MTKSKVVTVRRAAAARILLVLARRVRWSNQPVLFISTSSDSDGVIADQAWDLNGDGLYDNGGGPSALRSFAAPGQYVVGLRVADNDGHASFASQTVTVVAAATESSFSPWACGVNPFPVVRFSGALTKRGAHLRRVTVDAPKGSTVRVGCRGRSCPYRNPDQHRVEDRRGLGCRCLSAACARRSDPDLHHQPRHDRQVHVLQDPAAGSRRCASTVVDFGSARRSVVWLAVQPVRDTRRRRVHHVVEEVDGDLFLAQRVMGEPRRARGASRSPDPRLLSGEPPWRPSAEGRWWRAGHALRPSRFRSPNAPGWRTGSMPWGS